ncbi:MAG: hypothetical protein ACWGMZ_09960, partial [Thermoguttaceae bacterium]
MKPRILQIISLLDHSGAGKQLCLLAEGLRHENFDVHVCAINAPANYTSDSPVWRCMAVGRSNLPGADVPLSVIDRRWSYDPKTFWELKQLIEGRKRWFAIDE